MFLVFKKSIEQILTLNMQIYFILNILIVILNIYTCKTDNYCTVDSQCSSTNENTRYILYDINEPEGFNLRRDVYMRMAIFAHKLNKSPENELSNFKLVLPPWTNLYHWINDTAREIINVNWAAFFNVDSLQKFAPVIEMHQYFDEIGNKYIDKAIIDEVYILQHFQDMFETGNFEERMNVTECDKPVKLNYYNYNNITAKSVQCLSFHGHASMLKDILLKNAARSTFFCHAEVVLHDRYGDRFYWEARRSMRFNDNLYAIANKFRSNFLQSNDENDRITKISNWSTYKPKHKPIGGPYLGVHLRRRDFLWGRPNEVPSISGAANQLQKLLQKLNLNDVFIATDAPYKEFQELKEILEPKYRIHKYVPTSESELQLRDGQIAIVDQIICSHARYFIGTHESTFSFRIQEEREILGFSSETTFNRLCGDNFEDCSKPSVWKIVY